MNRSSTPSKHKLPIRICFMIDNLNRAGVETQLVKIINQLDRSKIDPYLCILAPRTDFAASFVPDDCPVFWLGLTSMRRPSAVGHGWKLAKYLRNNKIDVLHLDLPGSTLFGIPVGWLARVPYIIRTRRDMGYWMGRIDHVTGRLYCSLVNMTITNCQACKQSVIDVERAKPETIAILLNDVDLSKFKHIPTWCEASCNGKPRVVGMVANLRPEKSPDVFIEAASLVLKKHPNTLFRIAGEGELRHELEQQIENLGLAGRVQLPGHVVDIPAFLSDLDVAVLSSKTEGMPNVIVEYMAAGRPVIATDVGGVRELITNNQHGVVVPPLDVPALASVIDRLLSKPELAASMATAGRKRVEEEYGGSSIAQRFESLLFQMMHIPNAVRLSQAVKGEQWDGSTCDKAVASSSR